MYKVSIFNNNVETVVHFPSANQEDPHVSKLPLKEGLSVVDTLSFSLYPNNQGYDKVYELSTKVKVFDLRDNTVRFTGRILDINNKMDSSGVVYKEVTVEGALSYLNDTKMRGTTIYGATVANFLSQMLSIHNSKVEAGKQIQLGNVDIPGNLYHTCEFKSTFAEIVAAKETVGGHIRVRETNDILYMDWLQSFSPNLLEVSLGVNMKDMVISKDVASLGTRIVPLGANNLTIESVNGGLDYIEDSTAKAIYGVVEKTVEYKDIKDATELRNTCINDLSNYTQPSYILSSNALDLSFLTNNKAEQFTLGVRLHLLNRFMGVDAIYSIVELSLDLLTPYNPTLTISQKPITLSNAINDLRKSSIQNNGIYNNVQIGSAYGIRATRSDGKVTTTMNATDGITIENNTKKVFSVDTNGNLVINDITANNGTYNNITVNQGNFNDIDVDTGTFNNIGITGALIIKDGDVTCTISANGIELVGPTGKKANIQILDDGNYSGSYIRDDLYVEDALRVFGDTILENYLNVKGDARISGDLIIGPDGYTLSDYIDERIKTLVKPESLK